MIPFSISWVWPERPGGWRWARNLSGAVCRARQARLILLASDAAPNTVRRCAHFGEAGNVLWLELPYTKAELGFQLGRGSCAMLALTDAGFAATLVEKLSPAGTPSAMAPLPSSCG